MVPWSCQVVALKIGDGEKIPPLITESLFHGYIGAPTIGLMSLSPIVYCMEIMGV